MLTGIKQFLRENGYSFYYSMNTPRITVECETDDVLCNLMALTSTNMNKWDIPHLNISIDVDTRTVKYLTEGGS